MRNYLALVKNYPQFLSTLTSTVIKPYLDSTIDCFSLARNPNDPRCIVFVLKLGRWDLHLCSAVELYRCFLYLIQWIASQLDNRYEEIVLIFDFKNFGFDKVAHFTPSIAKSLAEVLQDSLPIRFCVVHLVNSPWYVKLILAIIWPFLSAEARNRIHNHGNSLSSLHRVTSVENLPLDYGGALQSMDGVSMFDLKPVENNFFNVSHD